MGSLLEMELNYGSTGGGRTWGLLRMSERAVEDELEILIKREGKRRTGKKRKTKSSRHNRVSPSETWENDLC